MVEARLRAMSEDGGCNTKAESAAVYLHCGSTALKPSPLAQHFNPLQQPQYISQLLQQGVHPPLTAVSSRELADEQAA